MHSYFAGLLVQLGDESVVVLRLGATIFEDGFDVLEQLDFPSGDGVRMHFELCRQLAKGFVVPIGGEGDFRFECRCVGDTFFDHND